MRNLTSGKRVFAYVGKAGYVGVGVVTGEMFPARDATVEIDGHKVPLVETPEVDQTFIDRVLSDDEEVMEMVVPVRWDRTVAMDQAVSEPGLFASQVTACKLRDERTLKAVSERFGLSDEEV